MSDEQTLAPEASDDVIVDQVEKTDEDQPEAVDNTEGQDDDQPAEASEEEAKEKVSQSKLRRERRKAVQDRLIAEKEAAEKERDAAQRKLAQIKANSETERPPKEEDFADYQEYIAALGAFKSLKAFDSREENNVKREAEERQKQIDTIQAQAQTEARAMFEDACAEARERYTDFEAVARNPTTPVSQFMAEVIVGLESGPDVLYALGKDPAHAARIAKMPPVQAALEIGRIEAGLARPKPITQSSAPAPITPVRGRGTPGKDPAKMTPAEYDKWREAGGTFKL